VLLAIGGPLLLTVSCTTPRTRHEWLTMFFDGVPPESGKVSSDVPGTGEEETEQESTITRETSVKRQKKPPMIVHDPYAERNCKACHASQFSQKLVGNIIDICLSCHEDFFESATVKHSPAEEGECLECHHPHESKEKYLLLHAEPALCYECHDEDDVEEQKAHAEIGKAACTSCHDPHKADNDALLKPGKNTGRDQTEE